MKTDEGSVGTGLRGGGLAEEMLLGGGLGGAELAGGGVTRGKLAGAGSCSLDLEDH